MNGDSATDDRRAFLRVAASFVFFALLLAAYYLIRPVRDSLVAGLGSEAIKFLSSGVLLVSAIVAAVYAWLVSNVPRRWLVPGLYAAFALKLLAFAVLFRLWPDSRFLAAGFYLWVAVFNLWMVSTFWSFMADLWSEGEARRHFGRIAAGGSFGGLVGPWLAQLFAIRLGPVGLMTLAAVLLVIGSGVAVALMRFIDRQGHLRSADPVSGGLSSGLTEIFRSPVLSRLAILIAGGSVLGMFLYIEVAKAAAALHPDVASRTAFFAERDLWVNALALGVQFVVAPVLLRGGVGRVLVLVALLSSLAFASLAVWQTVPVLLGVNILLRVVEFGLAKPSRDATYAALPDSAKYRAKNLIDTVFYRACDSTAGWLHALITSIGGGYIVIGCVGALAGTGLARVGQGIGARLRVTQQ